MCPLGDVEFLSLGRDMCKGISKAILKMVVAYGRQVWIDVQWSGRREYRNNVAWFQMSVRARCRTDYRIAGISDRSPISSAGGVSYAHALKC